MTLYQINFIPNFCTHNLKLTCSKHVDNLKLLQKYNFSVKDGPCTIELSSNDDILEIARLFNAELTITPSNFDGNILPIIEVHHDY